jgi:hypothetical protein
MHRACRSYLSPAISRTIRWYVVKMSYHPAELKNILCAELATLVQILCSFLTLPLGLRHTMLVPVVDTSPYVSLSNAFAVGAGSVAAGINPISEQFHVSHQKAGYLTTTYTLFSGVTPLLITPYVNLYGRRPAYLVCSITTSLPLFGADCESSVVFNHGRLGQQYRVSVFHVVWRSDCISHFRGRGLSLFGNWRCHSLFPSSPYVTIILFADPKNDRFVICSSKESVDALWASTRWRSPTVYVYLFPLEGQLLT